MPTIIKSDKYSSANLGSAASFGVTMPFNLSTLVAEGIWSLRKVRLAYSAQVGTVYQATTAAYGSLAFDVNNGVSGSSVVTITVPGTSGYSIGQQVTLTAFAATADVHMVQWNDQSGNGRHMAGGAVATAPRLYIAGVLQTLGTKPSLVTDGVNDYLGSTFTRAQPYSLVVAAQGGVNGGASNLLSSGPGGLGDVSVNHTVPTKTFMYAGTVLGDAVVRSGAPHVIASKFNGATSTIYADRAQVATGNAGTPAAATTLRIGSLYNATAYYPNRYWEVLAYSGAGTDLDAIAANVMAYYGL